MTFDPTGTVPEAAVPGRTVGRGPETERGHGGFPGTALRDAGTAGAGHTGSGTGPHPTERGGGQPGGPQLPAPQQGERTTGKTHPYILNLNYQNTSEQ